jgi:hypothetical protein
MTYYTDWTQIPLPHLVLAILSIIWILMHFTGPALMLVTKIFCLDRYKVYRIYKLLRMTKWIMLGVILIGWATYGQ